MCALAGAKHAHEHVCVLSHAQPVMGIWCIHLSGVHLVMRAYSMQAGAHVHMHVNFHVCACVSVCVCVCVCLCILVGSAGTVNKHLINRYRLVWQSSDTY